MSYILEGLKKLERKRKKEDTWKGLLFSREEEVFQIRKRPFWPYGLLVAALLLNAVLLVFWFTSGPSSPPGPVKGRTPIRLEPRRSLEPKRISPQSLPAVATPTAPVARPRREASLPPPKGVEAKKISLPASPPPPQAPEKADMTAGSAQTPTGEMPAEIRQKLPPLKMSLHFYSTDPNSRFVVINQRNLREGETFGEDLKVVEIHSDGVVLQYRGYRFLLRIGEGS